MTSTSWPASTCPISVRAWSAVMPGDGRDRSLVEGDRGWLAGELVRVRDGVLRVRARADAEDLVADGEAIDVRTDGHDAPGDVGTRDRLLGSPEPEAHEPDEVRQPGHEVPHAPVDAGGVDLDEDLVCLDGAVARSPRAGASRSTRRRVGRWRASSRPRPAFAAWPRWPAPGVWLPACRSPSICRCACVSYLVRLIAGMLSY